MIVLLLSLREVEDLLAGRSDKSVKDYLKRSLSMERLLPDGTLPKRVMLEQVEGTERDYLAVIREFGSEEEADQAWEDGLSSPAVRVHSDHESPSPRA